MKKPTEIVIYLVKFLSSSGVYEEFLFVKSMVVDWNYCCIYSSTVHFCFEFPELKLYFSLLFGRVHKLRTPVQKVSKTSEIYIIAVVKWTELSWILGQTKNTLKFLNL